MMTSAGTILLIAGSYLFNIITTLICINCLLSWFRPNPDNPIVRVIYGLTEPIMAPLRRFTTFGGMDFSGLAAILLIEFIIYPVYSWVVTLIF
ncbi:YggT family protein [Eubacterium aggregans]|uniref:YggT family protein n=1 Tax=Eubacterium aggregans TaxID=81409 RepID=UPI003F3FFF2E